MLSVAESWVIRDLFNHGDDRLSKIKAGSPVVEKYTMWKENCEQMPEV